MRGEEDFEDRVLVNKPVIQTNNYLRPELNQLFLLRKDSIHDHNQTFVSVREYTI